MPTKKLEPTRRAFRWGGPARGSRSTGVRSGEVQVTSAPRRPLLFSRTSAPTRFVKCEPAWAMVISLFEPMGRRKPSRMLPAIIFVICRWSQFFPYMANYGSAMENNGLKLFINQIAGGCAFLEETFVSSSDWYVQLRYQSHTWENRAQQADPTGFYVYTFPLDQKCWTSKLVHEMNELTNVMDYGNARRPTVLSPSVG